MVYISSRKADCGNHRGGRTRRSRRSRRPHAQPQEYRSDAAARQADHRHRCQRVGEVVAGLRHDLRRRAAPLRRVALGLRAAVSRADGEAGRRSHRRHFAGDCDPAEEQRPQSAVDRRDDDGDSRLHAAAVCPRRADVLPQLREGSRPRNRGGGRAEARRPALRHAIAARLRPAGGGNLSRFGLARGGRTDRSGRDRGRVSLACPELLEERPRKGGRFGARQPAQEGVRAAAHRRARRHHRRRGSGVDRRSIHPAGRRRSAAGGRRRASPAADRLDRDGVPGRRRRRLGTAVVGRGVTSHPSVFRALRVPDLRDPVRGSAAAAVLLQQPVRRLPDVSRLRQHHRARHGPGRAGSARNRSSRARSSRGASRTIARSSPS